MTESLSELYQGCRSYRRFQQKPVTHEQLLEIMETARKRSSGVNAQPLRFVGVESPETVAAVQPCLGWAAKLPKEIGTPKPGEQPVAFIVVLGPEKMNPIANIDLGIDLDTMAITAWSYGIGSCILKSINLEELAKTVPVPEGFGICAVLALGYPAHTSTVVAPDEEHGLSYYVDEDRNYYVPKRPAEEVIRFL